MSKEFITVSFTFERTAILPPLTPPIISIHQAIHNSTICNPPPLLSPFHRLLLHLDKRGTSSSSLFFFFLEDDSRTSDDLGHQRDGSTYRLYFLWLALIPSYSVSVDVFSSADVTPPEAIDSR
ncbi:hypothetical protein L2E82_50079 [Cichorium intybus]|nr:hypothetical protein L2E82_50079 [Cichorium intybus]